LICLHKIMLHGGELIGAVLALALPTKPAH